MNRDNAVIAGRVRDVVHSGDAVVETERGVWFTRGALPGEHVLIRPQGKSGRVSRASLVRVTQASEARVEPRCAYVSRCGGCPLMHASLSLQHELKRRFLREALVKHGVPRDLEIELRATHLTLGYRRRARLSFFAQKAGVAFGFRRGRSRDVVDVDACIVLDPALARALSRLRETLVPRLTGEGEVLLARGLSGACVVLVRSEAAQSAAVYAAAEALVDGRDIQGVAVQAGGASVPAKLGDPREGAMGPDDAPLLGTAGGFSQAHDDVNRALVAHVVELAETQGARVLELYAGHGNLTVALAAGAESYTAVEQDAAAVQACRENLAVRGLSAKLVTGDAAHHLGKGPIDVVVLDPPRTGAPGVLKAVAARKPKRIVYVSCDPATLGRDVGELLPLGYALDRATVFDMFPQSADLESVVRLVRAS